MLWNLRLIDRHRRKWRIISAVIALTIFHNEIFIYWRDSTRWPYLTCEKVAENDCLSMLIVADPQILGPLSEPLGRVGYMDTDPYLSKSFSYAFNHVKPDIVIFLGDLIDEGSTSSEEQYQILNARFNSIFNIRNHSKVIYIPGDNDIGGEGYDRVTEDKIQRFNKNFPSPSELVYKDVQFVPVNRIVPDFSLPKVPTFNGKQRVLLSHIPLIFLPGIFTREVLDNFRSNVIFSAHDHRLAAASVRFDNIENIEIINAFERDDVFRKQLNDEECLEIIWPTCSYRMGVQKMAYGSAVIRSDGTFEAGILWIHSRFSTLYLYLFVIVLCLVILIFPKC